MNKLILSLTIIAACYAGIRSDSRGNLQNRRSWACRDYDQANTECAAMAAVDGRLRELTARA